MMTSHSRLTEPTTHGPGRADVEWSLILGDLLHNLRSALDHLAWQLVVDGGGTPSQDTNFPVCCSTQVSRVQRSLSGAQPG